ncbi:MAG TPA: hypothetical protein VLN90_06055 [Thioalkalivibrio sp.]|nr:hypothetical protein [Thioalkalivibrio sp.]
MSMKHASLALSLLILAVAGMGNAHAQAANAKANVDCPVGLVSGMTLDDEFGPGTAALTECNKFRSNVRLVVQINAFCAQPGVPNQNCARPYALGNLANMIDDYEVTHGMVAGRDYEMVAVIHSGAGFMALKDTGLNGAGMTVQGRNQFEGTVRTLMSRGVDFKFCQNTTRAYVGNGILPSSGDGATGEVIEGIGYVTAGLTSIADYQRRGYLYIQP